MDSKMGLPGEGKRLIIYSAVSVQ